MENCIVNCKCKKKGNFLEVKISASQECLFNPENNHIYGFFCHPDDNTPICPNTPLKPQCQSYELKRCSKTQLKDPKCRYTNVHFCTVKAETPPCAKEKPCAIENPCQNEKLCSIEQPCTVETICSMEKPCCAQSETWDICDKQPKHPFKTDKESCLIEAKNPKTGVTYLIDPNELVVQAVIRDDANFENPLMNYTKKGRKSGGLLKTCGNMDEMMGYDSAKKKSICEFCFKKLNEMCYNKTENFGSKLYGDKICDIPLEPTRIESPVLTLSDKFSNIAQNTIISNQTEYPKTSLEHKTSHLEIRPRIESHSIAHSCGNQTLIKKTKDEYTQCTYNAESKFKKADKKSGSCLILTSKNESEIKVNSNKSLNVKKSEKRGKSKRFQSKRRKTSKADDCKERSLKRHSAVSLTDDDEDTYYYEKKCRKKKEPRQKDFECKCYVQQNDPPPQIVLVNKIDRGSFPKQNPRDNCCGCDFRICSDLPVNNFMNNYQPACPNEVVFNRESLYGCTPSYCNALEKCLEKSLRVKLKEVTGLRSCANQQFVKRLSTLNELAKTQEKPADEEYSDYAYEYEDEYVYEDEYGNEIPKTKSKKTTQNKTNHNLLH